VAPGAVRLSFVTDRVRAGRMETIGNQLVLGSGAPGPSPVILSEREEMLPLTLPAQTTRMPVRAEPACAASADLRKGTNLVITGSFDRFSAALAAARKDRRRGRRAEIVSGRWLVPAEETFVETFVVAAGAFADRDQADRRAAALGGRVAAVAAIGPSGPVPAWGLAGAGRVDGLTGAIDVRDGRVVMWSGPLSTGWRLGADALQLEAAAASPDADSSPAEMVDPYSAAKIPGRLGPRFPGLDAALGDGPAAAVVRYDDRRDELQAVETAGKAERIVWALPLGARDRLVQVFPRRGGLFLRFHGTLFLLERAAAAAPGPRLGKLCGKLSGDRGGARKGTRGGTLLLPAAAAGGDPLRLDTGDGTFELWAPVPSVVEPVVDASTIRCGGDRTARSDAPAGGLLTELGARFDIEIGCDGE